MRMMTIMMKMSTMKPLYFDKEVAAVLAGAILGWRENEVCEFGGAVELS